MTCHGGYSYLKCGELYFHNSYFVSRNQITLIKLRNAIIFYLHEDNGKIQINTANYGRTDKITCSEGRPSIQLQNNKCYSPNALAPVSKRFDEMFNAVCNFCCTLLSLVMTNVSILYFFLSVKLQWLGKL